MRRIRAAAMAAAVAAGFVTVVATASPAQAAGCRTSPYSATFSKNFASAATYLLPSSSTNYTTTTKCSDIQIKSTNGRGLFACVIFTAHTSSCNYDTYVPYNGSWVNIATTVLDGTKFRVKIWEDPECGGAGSSENCSTTYGAGALDF